GVFAQLESVTTNVDGTTFLNGSTVRTTRDQTYNDAVMLGADTFLQGGSITFNSTVNSNSSISPPTLSFSASGDIMFGDDLGSGSPLSLVAVFTANNVNNSGHVFDANYFQAAGNIASVSDASPSENGDFVRDFYDVTSRMIDPSGNVTAKYYIR